MPGAEPRDEDVIREEAAAWLARLRSGDGSGHADFERWYLADPRHAAVYDALLETWERAAMAAATPAGAGRERLAARGRHVRMRWMAAAAALALIVLGTIAFSRPHGDTGSSPLLAASGGAPRALALSDGSGVTLDAQSRIEADYSDARRDLTLRAGRARFDVAHDARRPFVVRAGGIEVIAHGTVFDMDSRGREIAVALISGSVEVRSSSGGAGRLLSPGEKLVIARGAAIGRASPRPLAPADRYWPSQRLSFEDAPLSEVIAAANRYGATRIRLADAATGERRFSGTFAASDKEALAALLARGFGLRQSRDARQDIVLHPIAPTPK